jgi:hypothetical protein
MTTKLQEVITKNTSLLMQGIDGLEAICKTAIKEKKCKPNQSDWIYMGNHIAVYVHYQMQKKIEELNERMMEARAKAQENHKKSGSATYFSENEARCLAVVEALEDSAKCWVQLCKDFGFRNNWNDLNDKPQRVASIEEINTMRANMGLEPLQDK